MAREQSSAKRRTDESLLNRRSYLRLAGSAAAAAVTGTAGAVASQGSDSSPTIERFRISKSEQLGSDQMFSVRWTVADDEEDLDFVEVAANDGSSSLDFAVQDVSGGQASGWELFQFPVGKELDVHVRATDSNGDTSRKTKTVTLGKVGEADILIPFDERSDLDEFTEMNHDDNRIASAPNRDGDAFEVPISEGSHYGTSCRSKFENETGSEPIEAYAEFYIYFPSSFEYADAGPGGTKLPGFAGTYDKAGWGGRSSDGTNGWSARMMNHDPTEGHWSRDHGLLSYVYHADMSGTYGDELEWNIGANSEQWHKISQYVKMNTPGRNDGVIRGWVDDDLALEREELMFREEGYENIKIEQFWFNVYHGGSWTAPTDTAIYFDDLKIKKNASSL
ncbi:polysaccharide lyase [Halorussus halobius]|uniref:polysaccharide lyase n=1 Tax=Halorussus halobius TaxID=1710537 RepID=UPI001093000E|nr:hypothetical protein [Halorussus halobius]